MSKLAAAWKLLRLLGRIPLKPLVVLWLIFKKTGLWIPIVLTVLLYPSIRGQYTYLTVEHGVHPVIGVVGAFGAELGGAIFALWNTLPLLVQGTSFEIAVLLLGASTALMNVVAYFYMWHFSLKVLEGDNLSPLTIHLIGGLVLTLLVVIAVLIEFYVLPVDAGRLPGMTYYLSNPELFLDLGGGEAVNQSVNETVNQSINATNTTTS